jgi:hypothetical protein
LSNKIGVFTPPPPPEKNLAPMYDPQPSSLQFNLLPLACPNTAYI